MTAKILPGCPWEDGSIYVVRIPQILHEDIFRIRDIYRIRVRCVDHVHGSILLVIVRSGFPVEAGISVAGGDSLQC